MDTYYNLLSSYLEGTKAVPCPKFLSVSDSPSMTPRFNLKVHIRLSLLSLTPQTPQLSISHSICWVEWSGGLAGAV